MNIRTRFAPSPTGLLHFGNIRTALFSDLYAKSCQGSMVLRIEDTDKLRSKPEYIAAIIEDLSWLGISWQEGSDNPGSYGPYQQSQRGDIYAHYYDLLLQQEKAYYCFCSEEELAFTRKLQLSKGKAPRYSGKCRALSASKVQDLLSSGLKPTLRFRVPQDSLISFNDLIKGPQQFNSNDIGDFIIRRADYSAAFMFCNAIDDALMAITQVLRGEDHLTNTPRQLMLLHALQLPQPAYGHLPLIIANDGAPLSKRHGSYSIRDLRQQGYLPQAIVNYLARLGHHYKATDCLSYKQLTQQFALNNIAHSAAHFDASQLLFWQKHALAALSNTELLSWLETTIDITIPADLTAGFIKLVRNNLNFPQDAAKWLKIFTASNLEFSPEQRQCLTSTGKQFFVAAATAVVEHGAVLSKITQVLHASMGLSGKQLYQPLRLALTGRDDGPELAAIMMLMPQAQVQARLLQASQLC
jgi:glutamyl-tRNA synthetase